MLVNCFIKHAVKLEWEWSDLLRPGLCTENIDWGGSMVAKVAFQIRAASRISVYLGTRQSRGVCGHAHPGNVCLAVCYRIWYILRNLSCRVFHIKNAAMKMSKFLVLKWLCLFLHVTTSVAIEQSFSQTKYIQQPERWILKLLWNHPALLTDRKLWT